jgi:hypothetical protein
VWLRDYAKQDVHISSQESDGESPPAKRSRFFDPFAVNIRLLQSRSIAVIGDEYEIWQRDKKRLNSDVRDSFIYWANKQNRYPRLSRMAMDFIIIQPMLVEFEKAFSAAGRMVTFMRARLNASIIGIYQMLRFWYLAGVLPEAGLEMAPVDLWDLSMTESAGEDEDLQYNNDRSATSNSDLG